MRIIMNQEPLGLAPDVILPNNLERWSDLNPSHYMTDYSAIGETRHTVSPFPYDPDINHKIILWSGDITCLQVDAIVNSTNESMNDNNPVSNRIYQKAGSALKEEITMDIKECRTGEVRVTQGHTLPARYIIHTVGPKYNIKYQSASETTLHCCYRNVLQKAKEIGLHSIGLTVINSVRRNYPPDEGAHIALRTVRRFLEHYGSSLDTIVFAIDEVVDWGIYQVLMPLYFPRSKMEEEAARWQLPSDIGGNDGEPILPDRQIRIIDNPQHTLHPDEESIDLSSQLETSITVGEHAFSQMQGDLDQQRLLGERPYNDPLADIMVKEIQHQERASGGVFLFIVNLNCKIMYADQLPEVPKDFNVSFKKAFYVWMRKTRYERLLRRAKSEDLTEVSGIGCLYQSGVDRLGRPVVVFIGKWFPFNKINLDKALLYLITLLDPIVKGDYVIAYFHTLTSSNNYPSFSWLKEIYNILPYKYKKNLKAFYVVHPTFWTKMMTWWFTTFMAPAIKQKVHSLPGVEYLYSVMSPDQLEIPAFITEYDMTINGLRYFTPGAPT